MAYVQGAMIGGRFGVDCREGSGHGTVSSGGVTHSGDSRTTARSADSAVVRWRTTRAGLPATTTSGGTSAVTTARAATTDRGPIVTPLRMRAPVPTHTS